MNFKIRFLFTATLMSSPVYGVELKDAYELLGKTEVVSAEAESRSFFRPKTMDDVREIASIKPDEIKVLDASSEEPNL